MQGQTQCWVGLGNPEPGQARNRHNVGFMAIDAIAAQYRFSPWRQRFKGLVAEGSIGAARILALKPLTYMNGSGESIQPALAFYKIPPEALFVLHDELDLALGRVRVKRGGGAAGHNGLRSTDRMLGSQDYWRIRLGIGHPGSKERVLGHVLGDFAKADQPLLTSVLDAVANAAPLLADTLTQTGAEAFMTRVALLTQEAG